MDLRRGLRPNPPRTPTDHRVGVDAGGRSVALSALVLGVAAARSWARGRRVDPAGVPIRRLFPSMAPGRPPLRPRRARWISLDVSPDGETIVFDLLGDLYTLPIAGGQATRLTSGMSFDAQPRWSPDGESVVFVSDRSGGDNVWTIRADRADTAQITQGNGSLYVFPRVDSGWRLHRREPLGWAGRGGQAPDVSQGPAQPPAGHSWSEPAQDHRGRVSAPTSASSGMPSRAGDWQYDALFPQYQIQRYGPRNGPVPHPHAAVWLRVQTCDFPRRKLAGLRDPGRHGYGAPKAGPSYRRGELARLSRAAGRHGVPGSPGRPPGYSFTPDSEAIVVSYGGKIWRVPMDGSAPAEIPFEVDVELDVGPEVKFDFQIDTAGHGHGPPDFAIR